MDNRSAFERQLANEIDYEVGPPQNVDALAIMRQAESMSIRRRFFTMPSTIKFAGAAIVLAAVGAALLVARVGPMAEDAAVNPPGAAPSDTTSDAASFTGEVNPSPVVEGPIDGVAAQDEEAAADVPAGSSFFTGTYTPVGQPDAMGSETTGPDGLTQILGEVYAGETIETSDPRVSGSLSRVVNWAEPTPSVYATAEAWRLENEGGSWTGQGTSLVHAGQGIGPSSFVTMVLSGDGVYEGLTAVVLVDRTQNPYAIEGAVIAGEPLPVPEPPAE